jgi:shikimate kinase
MNSKENLVFLGMMGSGKSSIGSLVSKKLNINFIDVDIEIEKKLDLKISEIFEIKVKNILDKLKRQKH